MKRVLHIVDSINDLVGRATKWIVLSLIFVTCYEVAARYVFNAPTFWGYQTIIVMCGSLFALSWGYAQVKDSHIRIDIFYRRLSRRAQAAVDVFGFSIFFLPLFAALTRAAFAAILWSERFDEVMAGTYWYPPALPFRIVVFVGIILVFCQFAATFIRNLHLLATGKSL